MIHSWAATDSNGTMSPYNMKVRFWQENQAAAVASGDNQGWKIHWGSKAWGGARTGTGGGGVSRGGSCDIVRFGGRCRGFGW